MSEYAEELARSLVGIGAVSFSPAKPFTWASGLLSPMYCDNRRTLAYPDVRALIERSFEELLANLGLQPEAIIGVATGAIPHAAVLAERLGLPFGYVRASAKQHGKQNQIEGFSRQGSRIVVVEDLVSTGGSSISAAMAAAGAGMQVEAVVAIFSYGFPVAKEAFEREGIPLHAIVDLHDLMAAAEASGTLDAADRSTLYEWLVDPVAWSERRKGEQ
ncbi:MAG TPA: orotate phosphoribosyltransferase [Rhodothermia bacterium]|nr:orotate phosphoribosyltransferase [Rhodothermia bacterium]